MGQEDRKRMGRLTEEALIEMGQTCCHLIQITELADKAYTTRHLLNCKQLKAYDFDITYDSGNGDKSDGWLKEEIKLAILKYPQKLSS